MLEKKNILLVDDEVISNLVNAAMLRKLDNIGMIESVNNGQEALGFLEDSIANSKPFPHIIFLDINMPIMNGFEFLAKLKEHPGLNNQIQIVMLSSSFDPRDKQKAKEWGVQRFIEKPLNLKVASQFFDC